MVGKRVGESRVAFQCATEATLDHDLPCPPHLTLSFTPSCLQRDKMNDSIAS